MLTTKEFMNGFEKQFEDITDPRKAGKITYPMIEILFLAVVAVAGKAEDWEDIEIILLIKKSILTLLYLVAKPF